MAGKGISTYPIPTIYSIDYRWPLHPVKCEKSMKESYKISKSVKKYTKAEAEALLEKLYKSRLRTTYDVSYTLPLSVRRSVGGGKEEEREVEESGEESKMLQQMKSIYADDVCPRPRPDLPTAKKLFGKAKPNLLLMGISEYQDHHGRLAYEKLVEWEKSHVMNKKK